MPFLPFFANQVKDTSDTGEHSMKCAGAGEPLTDVASWEGAGPQ